MSECTGHRVERPQGRDSILSRTAIPAYRDEFQRLCAQDVVVPMERGDRAREAVGVAAG